MPYWTNVLTETSISYVCGGRGRGAPEGDDHCAAGELNAEGGSSRRPSRSRRSSMVKLTPDEAEAKAERLRNELIDKVRHGKLTPAKVEAKAVRLGLSPLARCPDADQFNPM